MNRSDEEEDNLRSIDRNINSRNTSNWDKYLYTICMFFNHLAFGMTCSLFGPTMVDMKYIFNTSMNYISLYNTFSSIGYLSGSLCGFLYKRINRQITLVLLLTFTSITTALIPFCPNLWTFYLCSLINGLGSGAWDNANNVWLIEMWPQNSAPFLQFSQFMYGLGCILAPLLDEPFLTGEERINNTTDPSIITTTDINKTVKQSVDRRSLLKTPFVVTGVIQVIIPFIFLIMFLVKRYKSPKQKLKRKHSSEDLVSEIDESYDSQTSLIEGSEHHKDRRILIVLIAICLATYTSLELAHFGYSSTYYQFISLRISAPKAAQILSVMATSYTVGRCVSAFIAIKIKPEVMIIYHYIIIIIAMLVLYVGQNSLSLIWFGNIIIGFGFSAMWPAIIAFAEQYIEVNDTIGTILVFSCGTVPLFSPFILGPLIENYAFILLEFECVYLIASIILFIIILYIIKSSIPSHRLVINA